MSYESQYSGVETPLQIAIQPSSIPGAGTGVFLFDNVRAGTRVLRVTTPPVTSIDNEELHSTCDSCFYHTLPTDQGSEENINVTISSIKLAACGGCKVFCYCSKHCQRKAWKDHHKYECKTLARHPKLATSARLLFRLLNKHKHGLISNQTWQAIEALTSHIDEHLATADSPAIQDAALAAKVCSGTELDLYAVQKLFCLLLTNSIAISSPEDGILGLTLEPFTALINHSCCPNVSISFQGTSLYVHALRNIAAGEELTHAYANINMGLQSRQEELLSRYFFKCQCSKCDAESKLVMNTTENPRQSREALEAQRRIQEQVKNQNDHVISDEDASELEDLDPVTSTRTANTSSR